MTNDQLVTKLIHDVLVNGYFIDHMQNSISAIGIRVSVILRILGKNDEADALIEEVAASGNDLERKVKALRPPVLSDDLDLDELINSLKTIGIEPLVVDETTTEEQFHAYIKRMSGDTQ